MLAAGRNEVSSLQLTIEEPLSPELALVCPELAERARRLLPDPGWLAPVVRTPAPAPPGRLAPFVFALSSLVVTLTPLFFVAFTIRHAVHH